MAGRSQGPKPELWTAAVCKGDGIPPLQPGEHMTLGQVRHPALQAAFVDEFKKWFLSTKSACKKWKGDKKLADTALPHLVKVANPLLTTKGTASVKNMLAAALGWDKVTCQQLKAMLTSCTHPDQARRLLLRNSKHASKDAPTQHKKQKRQQDADADEDSDADADADADGDADEDGSSSSSSSDWEDEEVDSEWQQQHSWFALPADLPVHPCVREGRVPQTDPRQALRGQSGIWAKQDMCEGFLLGPYRSYCMYTSTYDAIRKQPPKNWTGTPSSWRLSLESYASNDDSGATGKVEVKEAKGDCPAGVFSFTNSGWGYGNITAYANDPHLNPPEHMYQPNFPDDYLGPFITGPDGQELKGCVLILYVSVCGWSYPFMATTTAVSKGAEMLYDYGHSYWVFWSDAMEVCKRDEQLQALLKENQAKEQQLREARRALTQATSGLTTSINITSSVAQPGSDTQGTYPAAATGAAGARNRVAAAAARLQSRLAAGAAAESVGGSCHVLHGSGGARTAGGGGGAGAAPQGSVGVSQMRQQLDGMQLQTQDRGSGGGESVGADASVAQQQHEQRVGAGCSNDVGGGAGGDGQLVAAGAVSEAAESVGGAHAVDAVGTSSGRTSPVDEQDDACSALLKGVSQFNLSSQQLHRLHQERQQLQHRQHMTETVDETGAVKKVQRIDDPDVVQMIKDAQMALSEELLQYSNGIKYKKIRPTWWSRFNALSHYFADKWDFIVRHSQLFALSQEHFSPNTRVELTPEWREALIAERKAKGQPLPAAVLAAEASGHDAADPAAAAAWQQQQQYWGSSNKRRRGQITLVKVVRDDAAERSLRKQLQHKEEALQEAHACVEKLQRSQRDLNARLQEAQGDVQQLLQLVASAGVRAPGDVVRRQQDREAYIAHAAAAGGGGGQGGRGGGGSGGGAAADRGRSRSGERHRKRGRSSSRSRSRGRNSSGQDRLQSGDSRWGGGRAAAAAAARPAVDVSKFDLRSAPVPMGLDSGGGRGGGYDSDGGSSSRSVTPPPPSPRAAGLRGGATHGSAAQDSDVAGGGNSYRAAAESSRAPQRVGAYGGGANGSRGQDEERRHWRGADAFGRHQQQQGHGDGGGGGQWQQQHQHPYGQQHQQQYGQPSPSHQQYDMRGGGRGRGGWRGRSGGGGGYR